MTRGARASAFVATFVVMVCPCMVRAEASIARTQTSPVLTTPAEWRVLADRGSSAAMFEAEVGRARAELAITMRSAVSVPTPRDAGGGFTHEQHKRNYRTIYLAGTLFRLTGDRNYLNVARTLLLKYAEIYPTLGPHPKGRGQIPGRLFWQTLNDAVWLVYSIQGYDAIREKLSAADREAIDSRVFRAMARFLSGTPENFDRIHNHATWAVAGVGMTGYVLRDRDFVERALLGSLKDGKSGFFAQIDQLFSPDGYYAEGPYYQRYASAPFLIFARAIERNDPGRQIFKHRQAVLLKSVDALLQMSYGGLLLPLNDAIKDKGIDSDEIVSAVAISYAMQADSRLLDIAQQQGRTVLTPDGLVVAEAVAGQRATPFQFRSVLLRDGAEGNRGGLALLRHGDQDGQLLVFKNTSQGMGHGHFDRLHWMFYDNGREVVSDYGSARFLNIEAKRGGIYLPENDSWAKQTVAHNTLVVNGTSQFGANAGRAEKSHPQPVLFESRPGLQIVSAHMEGAFDGATASRVMALLETPHAAHPLIIDHLRVHATAPSSFDLPLHFDGQIMRVDFEVERYTRNRPLLGDRAGYQHLWIDAVSPPDLGPRDLTWMTGNRFYTYHFGATEKSRAFIAEIGANDPEWNLRHAPVLVQRTELSSDTTFFGVLEPHGEYNGVAETVGASDSAISTIALHRGKGCDVVEIVFAVGSRVALGVSHSFDPAASHFVKSGDRSFEWEGPFATFDDESAR